MRSTYGTTARINVQQNCVFDQSLAAYLHVQNGTCWNDCRSFYRLVFFNACSNVCHHATFNSPFLRTNHLIQYLDSCFKWANVKKTIMITSDNQMKRKKKLIWNQKLRIPAMFDCFSDVIFFYPSVTTEMKVKSIDFQR